MIPAEYIILKINMFMIKNYLGEDFVYDLYGISRD